MERIKPEILLTSYEDCTVKKSHSWDTYIFGNEKGHYLEVMVCDENKQYRFIDDNFPFPRRFFNTDIPICSIEDFEADLKRMRIELPKRKE